MGVHVLFERGILPEGTHARLPDLPTEIDADSTARWIASVLDHRLAVPEPIALQVEHILHLLAHEPATP